VGAKGTPGVSLPSTLRAIFWPGPQPAAALTAEPELLLEGLLPLEELPLLEELLLGELLVGELLVEELLVGELLELLEDSEELLVSLEPPSFLVEL
jgi:hypothetical protein